MRKGLPNIKNLNHKHEAVGNKAERGGQRCHKTLKGESNEQANGPPPTAYGPGWADWKYQPKKWASRYTSLA